MATNYEIGQTFTPDDLRDMALQVADHYEIPKDLFLGLNAHESSWNPAAKNPKSSARGLGQFIDSTAKTYFDEPITNDGNDPRYHPGKSLDASARYLKDLYGQYGDWEKAVLHYGENTPAYLNAVKAAAGREADEHDHFKQGQFMEVAGGADLGFGMSPAYQDTRRKPVDYITGNREGLHPQVMQQFDLMAQEFYERTGEPLIIASGRRSTARQAELYAADPNSGYVAKPGTSRHETGEAIDLDKSQVKKVEELGLLEKYGFYRPMQGQGAQKVNEPWHIQLTDEFKQGQFMNVAGGTDLGFGMSPVGQEAQPGALYQGVREYLGLNKEPWKMSPVLQNIAADYMKTPATYPGMTQEEQNTAGLASDVAQAAPLGLSGEDLLFPGQRQKDIVESEAMRVMGRYVDNITGGVTEGAKKAAFGDTFMPETPFGTFLGQGAALAGQIMGPFKLIKMLTGSYLFPTVEGVRTTSQILAAGMKEGAVNLGLLQGLSRVVPAMIEHEDFSKWAMSVLSDAKGGALVGLAFPMLSLLPGQGLVGAGVRMATGFAAMDYLRAAPGKWSTLGDLSRAFQTWDEESKKQFASLSYQYLLDLYFANSVRPIREQMAAYKQNQILSAMTKLQPQELEKEILAVRGQQPPPELNVAAPGGPAETKGTATVETPQVVKDINPDVVPSFEGPQTAESQGFKPSVEWQTLKEGLTYPPGGEFRRGASGENQGRWPSLAAAGETKVEAQPIGPGEVTEQPGVAEGTTRAKQIYNLDKALEGFDRATVLKAYGGFNSRADILKNFAPEERRLLFPFMRKGAQGPDELLREVRSSYPHLFGEFETDGDLLRAAIDGRLKPRDYNKLEEHYNDAIAREAEAGGLDEAALSQAHAIAEREIALERVAIQNEPKPGEPLDLAWPGRQDFLTPTRVRQTPKLTARLDALQADYPGIDRERAAIVIRALPKAEDGQISNMAADPEMFNQVARGNLAASEKAQLLKKATDAGAQRSLLGESPQGGLFETPIPPVASGFPPGVKEFQVEKMYSGGPDTATLLGQLRENVAGAGERWQAVKDNIRETVAPASLLKGEQRTVGQALVTMMGRKEEAIKQAGYALMGFRKLFERTSPAEWSKIVSAWQRGEKSGTDLDRAYEVFHEINEALVPQISEFKDLPYQENYLRQAWKNSKDGNFRENIGRFQGGDAFKNYHDLNEAGNPRIYRAKFFDEKGGYELEKIGEGIGGKPGEPEVTGEGYGYGRTLTGGRSYFQAKKIPDYETGMMLGGIPKFKNLFDLMMFDIREKNQFIWGNKLMQWAYEHEYIKVNLSSKMPFDWQEVKDPTQRISFTKLMEIHEAKPFESMPADYDMTAPGAYKIGIANYVLAAPRDAARIFNNWLSPGLRGNAVYDLYRDVVDAVRRIGVAISTFHLRFTMNNSLATGTGQALSKAMGDLIAGDMEGVAKAVKSGVLNLTGKQFISQLSEGKALAEALYKGSDDPILKGTLRRFIDTGGTLPPPESMRPIFKSMGEAMWEGLVNLNPYGGFHPFKAAGKFIEAGTEPIMSHVVPFAKLGGFAVLDRALSEKLDAKYEKLAAASPDRSQELAAQRETEYTNGLFEINKHLDNIYGQMNYDALLINKTVKDLLFFVIKYPGWNIGSGRWMWAMAGGLKHSLTPGQQASVGEQEAMRMGLGLVVNMGIYSSLMYWFINGEAPPDVSELFTKGVWTGGYTRGGNKEYIRDASYWRDLWGMTPINQQGEFAPGKPFQTMGAKAQDILRIPLEIGANKEFYSGYQIRTPGGDPEQQLVQIAKYAGKQIVPYSFRGMYQGISPWAKYGSFAGFTPTPARLTDTPAMQELRSYREAEAPVMVTTQKQGQREVKRNLMDFAYEGDGQGFIQALRQARSEGQVTSSQYKDLVKDGHEIIQDPHYGPLRNTFRKLTDLGEAIKVYGLATPEERDALRKVMMTKWGGAQPETRRKYRQDFMELKARVESGQ